VFHKAIQKIKVTRFYGPRCILVYTGNYVEWCTRSKTSRLELGLDQAIAVRQFLKRLALVIQLRAVVDWKGRGRNCNCSWKFLTKRLLARDSIKV